MKKNNTIIVLYGLVFLLAILVGVSFTETKNVLYSLDNGGFENGTLGWAVRHGYSLDNNNFYSGKASIKSSNTYYDPSIDPSLGDARAMWIEKSVSVKAGDEVFASAMMKTQTYNCAYGLRIGIDFKTTNGSIVRAANGDFVSWGNNPSVWVYREIKDVVRPGEEKITLWLQTKPHDCPGLGWFDNVHLVVTR